VSNIFISYRRSDSAPYAGRLFDRLTAHFSDPQVFMDLEIKPGDDFVERLEDGVGHCDVLLVLIGPGWLGAEDAEGARRLDDPEDFARIEILAALNRDIRVIPVLVGGAVMPTARDLPQALMPLARRQALEVSDLRFRADTDRLIEVIEEELDARAAQVDKAEREKAEREKGARDEQARLAAEAPSVETWGEHGRAAPDEGERPAVAQREKERVVPANQQVPAMRREHERQGPAAAQPTSDLGQAPEPARPAPDGGPVGRLTRTQWRVLAVVSVICVLVALGIGAITVSSGGEDVAADPVVSVVGSAPSWRFEPNELTVPHNTSFTVVNETDDIISLRTSGLQGCLGGLCPAIDPGRQQSLTVANLSGGSVSFPGRGPSDSLLVETR
jgi:hypothetical protein